MELQFPNGFEDWYETHHIVVTFINQQEDAGGTVSMIHETVGMGGIWLLGKALTDEFELLTKGVDWGNDGRDYHEELETFLNSKNL